jgi:hypothetical protein
MNRKEHDIKMFAIFTAIIKVLGEYLNYLANARPDNCPDEKVYKWTRDQIELATGLQHRLQAQIKPIVRPTKFGKPDYHLTQDEIVMLLGVEKTMKELRWMLKSNLTPDDVSLYGNFCRILLAVERDDYRLNFAKQRLKKQ